MIAPRYVDNPEKFTFELLTTMDNGRAVGSIIQMDWYHSWTNYASLEIIISHKTHEDEIWLAWGGLESSKRLHCRKKIITSKKNLWEWN